MEFLKLRKTSFKLVLIVLISITFYFNLKNKLKFNFSNSPKYLLDEINSYETQRSINDTDDFKKELQTFMNIIRYDCNPSVNKIDRENCIEKLLKYDKFLISQNKNKRLNETEGCDKCLYILNQKKIVYYHVFWQFANHESNKIRMAKLNIMSFLATQNLCCTKLIFWKLDEFPIQVNEDLDKMFSFYIKNDKLEIKTFRIKDFCDSGFFKKTVCGSQTNLNSKSLVGLSDLVRFVVLDKYPGIYTDGDTIFLKDMRFLWYFNFAYRWSFLHTYNTAVLGINKLIDPSINKLYDIVNTDSATLDYLINAFHPQALGATVSSLNNQIIYNYSSLLPVHPHFFDGAWYKNFY